MVSVSVVPTAHLPAAGLAAIRDLMDAAFDNFTDLDWAHTLGGLHVVVRDADARDGAVVAHGAVVQRRLLVEGRSLRCGYVASVAVAPDRKREGLGDRVMAELEALAPGHDLLALSSSTEGFPLYASRGWQPWRGPSSVLAPSGIEPTPDRDGSIHVLGGPAGGPLDLDAPITCDWRDGDVW